MALGRAVRLLPELGAPLQQLLVERRQAWVASQGLIDAPTLTARLGLDARQFEAAQRLQLIAPEPWPAELLLPNEWGGATCGHYRPDLVLTDTQRQQIRAAVLLTREAAACELGVTLAQFDHLRRQTGLVATAAGTYRLSDLDALRGQAPTLPLPGTSSGPTLRQRWEALNDRQRAYLLAIFRLDQQQEEHERGSWSHGERRRPAAEWRLLDYGLLPYLPPVPTALYEAIERLGLRDAGTGSTFQALESRKLIKCRYHLPDRQVELCVEITALGRQVVRAGTGKGASSRNLLPEWAWRWLADLFVAGEQGSQRMGEGTRTYLRKRGLVTEERQGQALYAPVVVRLSEAGRAYYEAQWAAYAERYPHVQAPPPAAAVAAGGSA
jgi:hypothetical protein